MKKFFISKLKFFKLNTFTILFCASGLFIFSALFLYGCSSTRQINNTVVTKRLYSKQNEIIYNLSFPLQFVLNVAYKNSNQISEIIVSGTGWIFDRLINNDPQVSTYYIATNHHCVDFERDLKESKSNKPNNLIPWFYTVNLNLPNYQFQTFEQNNQCEFSNLHQDADYSYNIQNDFGTYLKKNLPNKNTSVSNMLLSTLDNNFNEINKYNVKETQNTIFDFSIITWSDLMAVTNNNFNIDLALIKISIQNNYKMNCMKFFDNEYFLKNSIPFLIGQTKKADLENKKFFVGGFPSNFESPQKDTVRWICTESKINAIEQLDGYINDKSTRREVGLSINLDLYNGSSGSIIMNEDCKIIGIYWGTITSKNLNEKLGCFDIFLLNNVFTTYKQYMNSIKENWHLLKFIK